MEALSEEPYTAASIGSTSSTMTPSCSSLTDLNISTPRCPSSLPTTTRSTACDETLPDADIAALTLKQPAPLTFSVSFQPAPLTLISTTPTKTNFTNIPQKLSTTQNTKLYQYPT